MDSKSAVKVFFRYTLCYWGNTEEKRERVKSHLARRGYVAADVTTWAYEWQWNRGFLNCRDKSDAAGAAFLKQSFLEFSAAQLNYDFRCMNEWFGREVPGVALAHNVAFFAEVAGSYFGGLRNEGLEFVSLEDGSRDSAYAAVASIVSDKFLVYHQKLAQLAGRPIPSLCPIYKQILTRWPR
jgi:peptidoglycan-N-acetylglucosamine deacetylase